MVSKNTTGNEDIINRDEYSIGLIAFNEAIDRYKPGLRSFQSFASEVIKKRIIDYLRSQEKHRTRNVYFDDPVEFPVTSHSGGTEEQVCVKMGMEFFIKSLQAYNITLSDLVRETPKHADSRLLCARIAKTITSDPEMLRHLQRYRTIPLKMLLKKIKVNEKTVERHRKYIIGICLVLVSDLEVLKDYVEKLIKGGVGDAE